MVPTSWRVREGGGAVALMPRCYAARTGLVRLVGRLPVGMGALRDTAALGDRATIVLVMLSSRARGLGYVSTPRRFAVSACFSHTDTVGVQRACQHGSAMSARWGASCRNTPARPW